MARNLSEIIQEFTDKEGCEEILVVDHLRTLVTKASVHVAGAADDQEGAPCRR